MTKLYANPEIKPTKAEQEEFKRMVQEDEAYAKAKMTFEEFKATKRTVPFNFDAETKELADDSNIAATYLDPEELFWIEFDTKGFFVASVASAGQDFRGTFEECEAELYRQSTTGKVN